MVLIGYHVFEQVGGGTKRRFNSVDSYVNMEQCNSIEISNIPKGAGRDEIYQLCSSFGKISSMKLVQDKGGHCTTKCTVWYEDPADAFECRRNLNGFHIGEEFLRTRNAIVREKEMAVTTVDIQSNIH